MIKLEEMIDLIIPRGGEELIRFVASKLPRACDQTLQRCLPSYVDKAADMDMAVRLTVNS